METENFDLQKSSLYGLMMAGLLVAFAAFAFSLVLQVPIYVDDLVRSYFVDSVHPE